MDQTIICTVLLCRTSDMLYVLSARTPNPEEQCFTYGGLLIEAAQAGPPGVSLIPAHWVERLRIQTQSTRQGLTLELCDEFSGGDPVPLERPYFPWDLEPEPEAEPKQPSDLELQFGPHHFLFKHLV